MLITGEQLRTREVAPEFSTAFPTTFHGSGWLHGDGYRLEAKSLLWPENMSFFWRDANCFAQQLAITSRLSRMSRMELMFSSVRFVRQRGVNFHLLFVLPQNFCVIHLLGSLYFFPFLLLLPFPHSFTWTFYLGQECPFWSLRKISARLKPSFERNLTIILCVKLEWTCRSIIDMPTEERGE